MKAAITLKQLFLSTLLVLVVIQFIPVDRENPPAGDGEMAAPRPVVDVLRRACFDCHSHETDWPWYARVAPASWLVARDVDEARGKLNFSRWNELDSREQAKLKGEIWEEVADGDMPPPLYVLVHPGGRVTTDEHPILRAWCGVAPPGY